MPKTDIAYTHLFDKTMKALTKGGLLLVSLDEKGKAITMIGPMDDPATGEMGKTVKYVITMPQNDRFAFEMHDMSITGPDKMVGEIIYTRAAEHR